MKEENIKERADHNKWEIDIDPKNIIMVPTRKEKIRGFKSNILILDDGWLSDESNNSNANLA